MSNHHFSKHNAEYKLLYGTTVDDRAEQIVSDGNVWREYQQNSKNYGRFLTYQVASQTNSNSSKMSYEINFDTKTDNATCTCNAFRYNTDECKHIVAVRQMRSRGEIDSEVLAMSLTDRKGTKRNVEMWV